MNYVGGGGGGAFTGELCGMWGGGGGIHGDIIHWTPLCAVISCQVGCRVTS